MTSILLIEDEKAIADAAIYALSTEGMKVTWHNNGRDGPDALKKSPFDLVVLDVGLPDGSGFDFCKEIRKSSTVPVIFLTARAGEVDRVVGLEIGADDFMAKPFSPRELAARIKAVLRRTTPAINSRPAQTPFQVNEGKLSITYFEKALNLTRYEFRLLKTLLERPGWVFTREQLLEKVWDDPLESDDRNVDAHIKSLRNKLREVNAEIDPIKTHRGTGYSLKEDW